MLDKTGKQENRDTSETVKDDSGLLEIYEFPGDCVAAELSYHFSCPPYSAQCKTPINRMWNPRSSTFVLEFSTSDVDKIMERPVQLLDEEDPSSEIKISRLEVRRCTQVLITCEHEMSSRMIKSYFRKFGEIENCCHQQYAILFGDYRAILTFKESSCAEKVASVPVHHVTQDLTINTKLLKDDMLSSYDDVDEPSSPSVTSLSLNFGMDSVSSILPPYKPPKGRNDSTYSLKFDVSQAVRPESNYDDVTSSDMSPLTLSDQQHPMNDLEPTSSLSNTDSHIYEQIDTQSLKPNEVHNPAEYSLQQLSAPRAPAPPAKPEPAPPVSPVNLQGCIQVNNCIMRLIRGDLSQHAADVLVHSRGYTSSMLHRKCNTGSTNVETIETVEVDGAGKIAVTTAPNLPAKYLFGFRLIDGDHGVSLQKFSKSCLQTCEKLDTRSIAFPALGTGSYGRSPSVMSTVLIKSILEYMKTQDQSRLEIIDIVVYEQHMVKDYKTSLKNSVNSHGAKSFSKAIPKKIKGKVENIYEV